MHNNHHVIIWQHQGFERKIARKAKVKVTTAASKMHICSQIPVRRSTDAIVHGTESLEAQIKLKVGLVF